MSNNLLESVYTEHHKSKKRFGYSVLETDRGKMISQLIGSGKKVLDIGCRDGTLTKYFSSDNYVVGVDIDQLALDKARAELGINIIKTNLEEDWHSELKGKKFDVVVAGEVLEHLRQPDQVVRKISECLADDGFFVGSVPNAFSLKNRLRYLCGHKKNTPLSDPTHINHFGYEELKNLLGKNFSNVEIVGLGRYKYLSQVSPSLIAFDLFFIAKK